MRMKNMNNFQAAMFSLKMLHSICLIFCRFRPGVAGKSVAYKKTRAKFRKSKEF